MSHPLDGCWAKIERADHNIKRLDALINAFLNVHAHNYVTDINDNSTEHTYRVLTPEPPPGLAVRAGEIVHHLRSSLDHLIWALVLERHQSPDFRVQFPICTDVTEYKKALRGHIIKGVSGSAQALIKRAQPYMPRIPVTTRWLSFMTLTTSTNIGSCWSLPVTPTFPIRSVSAATGSSLTKSSSSRKLEQAHGPGRRR
jgi:hypothetical protein